MTIDKSCTIGATTVRMRKTEHDSVHVTDICGPQQREIYIPMGLLLVFMAAYNAAHPAEEQQQCTTGPSPSS